MAFKTRLENAKETSTVIDCELLKTKFEARTKQIFFHLTVNVNVEFDSSMIKL